MKNEPEKQLGLGLGRAKQSDDLLRLARNIGFTMVEVEALARTYNPALRFDRNAAPDRRAQRDRAKVDSGEIA